MIAQIIPIKRLPGSLGIFDYNVPNELIDKIKIGQLAIIPFRKSVIYGLVFNIQDTEKNNKLKQIERLVHEMPFLGKTNLDFIFDLHKYYATSLSVLSKMCLPPLQKRKLSKIDLQNNFSQTNILRDTSKIDFIFYKNETEHAKYLSSNIEDQTLILVPAVHLIDDVLNLLPKETKENTAVWHSQLSIKKQYDTWLDIRNQKKQIIIGTRGSLFLPFPHLKNIIIDCEHDENHKNWDQTPRLHSKDAAQILASKYNAKIQLMSYSPTCESYFHVHKNNYDSQTNIAFSSDKNISDKKIKIVDLTDERRAGRYDIFSDYAKEKLLSATGDIFIYMNRLGFATSAGCQNCGWIAKCDSCGQTLTFRSNNTLGCNYCRSNIKMYSACPKCDNIMVRLRGAGTEFIESEVRKLFQDRQSHDIIRLDSDLQSEITRHDKPMIIVGTKMAFSKIDWKKTDVIIFVDIDKEINMPEYLSGENAWHLIQEVIYRKNTNTSFAIQTFNPAHLIFRSLDEPDRFYRTELNSRQKMLYPPYSYLTRFFCGYDTPEHARSEADRIYDLMVKVLTKEQKDAKITNPIEMSPRYFRHKYWYVILAKIEPGQWPDILKIINTVIPPDWKIDPNPVSILSP